MIEVSLCTDRTVRCKTGAQATEECRFYQAVKAIY